MKNRLFAVGVIGSLAAAVCCFTPALVLLLGAIGLSVAVPYLDFALLPLLGAFVVLTVYALVRRGRHSCEEDPAAAEPEP